MNFKSVFHIERYIFVFKTASFWQHAISNIYVML